MTDLRTLHDAFATLERRADAAQTRETLTQRHRGRSARVLAPVAAAAAVALAAAGIAVWQSTGTGRPTTPAAGSSAAPSAQPTTASPTPTLSGTPNGRYVPPSTAAELTRKTQAILAGIATISVIHDPETPGRLGSVSPTASGGPATVVPVDPSGVPPSDGASGSAIRGTLTAAGESGGFDLNVFATTQTRPTCDGDTPDCSIRTLPDGSFLVIGTWRDPQAPGGMTYQVEAVRPDGADILLHLSTERDPKGESAVTASHLPLTLDEMIAFVTSDQW